MRLRMLLAAAIGATAIGAAWPGAAAPAWNVAAVAVANVPAASSAAAVATTAAAPPPAPAPIPAGTSAARTAGSPWRWEGVERIVAIGDVHGASVELAGLLREARLTDAQGAWIGGTTHLVLLGDLEDRGPDGRKVIDRLRALQAQAKKAGGAVHALMGNHEVMNLVGDVRYVTEEDCAAFAAEEPRLVRGSALKRARRMAREQGITEAHAVATFEKRFPRGFFARRAAFSRRGEYGAWITELPVAVVLNGTAFVHGGAGEGLTRIAAAAKSAGVDPLDAVTRSARDALRSFLEAEHDLQAAGVLMPETTFAEGLWRAKEYLKANEADGSAELAPLPPSTPEVRPFGSAEPRGDTEDREAGSAHPGEGGTAPGRQKLIDAARRYLAIQDSLLFRSDGPLWYRAGSDETVEIPRLDAALAALRADRLVVGHTPTAERRITVRFGGRLVGVDTGMLTSYYKGRPAALELTAGGATALYAGDPPERLDLGSPVRIAGPAAAGAGAVDGETPAGGVAESAAPETEEPVRLPPAAPPAANNEETARGQVGNLSPEPPAPARGVLSDEEIESFLATAEIVKKEKIGTGITKPLRLTLRGADGVERRAIYKNVNEEIIGMVKAGGAVQMSHADKYAFEIAAYRLDRLIGLNMVPVTVERAVDGKPGSVQDWVEDSVSEMRRKADGNEPPDENVLERQRELMRLFDVLLYNTDRNATNLLVTPADWKVHLIDHSRSFRLESRPPDNLRAIHIPVPDDLQARLSVLDLPALTNRLGKLLSREQLKAILKRRDWLLAQAGAAP